MNSSSNVRTFIVETDETGTRLDVFLAKHAGLSRSRIKHLIVEGYSVIKNGKVPKPSYPVETGDIIEITTPSSEEPDFLPENIPIDIIYEDEHIIVVNKPSGMVVHPGRGNFTGTLASAVLYHCKSLSGVGDKLRPGIVHRLDMGTSGLIVVALKNESHGILSKMIHDHEVKRFYTAFVWGHPEPSHGTIDAPIGRHPKIGTLRTVVKDGKHAVTHYKVNQSYDFLSKLSVQLETGRTHQIRVHLAYRGHQVFGDPFYGGREERLKGFSPDIRDKAKKLLKNLNRQALHAERLEFKHPVTGEYLIIDGRLPDDLCTLMKALETE